MRLLLDENLSPQQAAALREQGHDAVAVLEVGLSGQPDEKIGACPIEENRVLLTLDVDFANKPTKEESVHEQIQKTLAVLKDTLLTGCLAVSHGDMIRIRS